MLSDRRKLVASARADDADAPTRSAPPVVVVDASPVAMPPVDADAGAPATSRVVRVFGSIGFFRLWLAQVVSAMGDWLGFLAVVAIAKEVGGGSGAGAISLVMTARMVPGLFLAPMAGVLVDRWNRKTVMVCCDIGRALVLVSLPFIGSLFGLVVASLLLELATLLWSPAKEASVPNLVPTSHLTSANSLSLAAAYGTFPIASLLFAGLEKFGDRLGHASSLSFFRFGQAGTMSIYADVLTFVASAFFISTLLLPPSRRTQQAELGVDFNGPFRDLREGWHFMFTDNVVRAVMLALATGLIGGGMVLPLGDLFSRDVLGGGSAGFGLLISAMGFGMAAGVLALSALQKRLPKHRMFSLAALGAGGSLLCAASMSAFTPALIFVGGLGLCAGGVYVLGFTILHESVADELRGRIFSSLYTLVRVCLLLSFAVGPLLADRLGALSQHWLHGEVHLGAAHVALPGVRLALWTSSLTILGAGVLSVRAFRRARPA